jgi:hypothetical protein
MSQNAFETSPVFILNEGHYTTHQGVCIGSRLVFLGILYGGPEFTKTGTIIFNVSPREPRVLTTIPINLGIMIKAQRIVEFENLF